MTECKVMIKASMKEAKARFREYEDMEFEKRGKWVLVESFSGTRLFGWGVSSWVELAARVCAHLRQEARHEADIRLKSAGEPAIDYPQRQLF